MKAFLAMAVFGVILYLASSCDVNTHGLMEDDMGSQKLDLYTNGIFRNVCIGRAEAATVGVSNVMNFKCNDGTVIHNITNYVIRK